MTLEELYVKLLDDDHGVGEEAFEAMQDHAVGLGDVDASRVLDQASATDGRFYLNCGVVRCWGEGDQTGTAWLPHALEGDDGAAAEYMTKELGWRPTRWTWLSR